MAQMQRRGGAPGLLRAVHEVRASAAVQVDVDKPVGQVQPVPLQRRKPRLGLAHGRDGLYQTVPQRDVAGGDGAVLDQAHIAYDRSHGTSSSAWASSRRSAVTLSAVASMPPAEKAAPPGRRISSSLMAACLR